MEKKRLQQGVFDELFELYYDKLTVFVYSYINDAEAARDIVNDLFLNLWKDRQSRPGRRMGNLVRALPG